MVYDALTSPSAHTLGAAAVALALLAVVALHLVHLNRLLSGTPEAFRRLSPDRWTPEQIRATCDRLAQQPITTSSYADRLPPPLGRRYVVTGGSGIVGGYIVLQLLARGEPPEAIRIVDFQRPHRADMLPPPDGSDSANENDHDSDAAARARAAAEQVARVGFQRADIASADATDAAFAAPWPSAAVAALPLTVFHTAAVIVPSARDARVSGFCEAVNVRGTAHVLAAARRAGADVVVSTSSASIAIRPVEFWGSGGGRGGGGEGEGEGDDEGLRFPRHYAQVLDEADFFAGPEARPHGEYFGNYPASKAKAERLVCGANGPEMRTGCIRPANGVYGHPSDNLLGAPLNMQTYPSWVEHMVQSFVHGINCAVAHLQLEAVLAAGPHAASLPQAGRPFVVTDPNPPITYGDLYAVVAAAATTPFRLVRLWPVPMLLLSYAVEFYNLLPVRLARLPALAKMGKLVLPRLPGGVAYLEPGLFSICTHLVADMRAAQAPVSQGGLGYRGVVTTLAGMCQEVLEWNREQEDHARRAGGRAGAKAYRSSLSLAEEIQKLGGAGKTAKC